MRVITGTARGRRLKTLPGEDVRPTADKVKEALFSIIQFDIEGRSVLDLFAGSGQLGIEALSRGAQKAVFVDSSKKALAVVGENVRACGFEASSRLVGADSLAFLQSCRERFDIAILDPPYASELLDKALPLTTRVMNKGGTIICESRTEKELPETAGEFTKRRVYRYGKIAITLYRHRESEQ